MITDIGRLVELLHRSIISVQFFSRTAAVVKCRYGIVFYLYRRNDRYDLYEYDGGKIYVLCKQIPTVNKVYDRMCEEHGCLRECIVQKRMVL